MSKSKIEKRLPEPQPKKEQKADGTSVRPAIAKPNVICSQSPPMNLSEAKKQLLVKSKNMLFDRFVDFILSSCKSVKGFYEWFNKKYKTKGFQPCVKVGEGFYIDISEMRNIYYKLHPLNTSFKMAIDIVNDYSNQK